MVFFARSNVLERFAYARVGPTRVTKTTAQPVGAKGRYLEDAVRIAAAHTKSEVLLDHPCRKALAAGGVVGATGKPIVRRARSSSRTLCSSNASLQTAMAAFAHVGWAHPVSALTAAVV